MSRNTGKYSIRVFLLNLFLIFVPFSMQGQASTLKTKVVESFEYNWAGSDSEPYKFILQGPDDDNYQENFTRVQISYKGKVVFMLSDKWGLYVQYKEKYVTLTLSDTLKNSCLKNPLKSDYLLMIPVIRGKSKYPLLFIFGWPYASSPGSLHVISLCDDGVPITILELQNFDLYDIKDVDGDSVPELIGKECCSQSWGHDFLTYDPYSVYRFGLTSASNMSLDMKLSQKYNEDNYYGWAGIKCQEDIAIVLHPPGGGKPVIMDSEKAKALFKTKK